MAENESYWYKEGVRRAQGFDAEGLAAAGMDEEAILDELFGLESNNRDFSPFEHTAAEINGLDEFASEEAWEDFDRGIADEFQRMAQAAVTGEPV